MKAYLCLHATAEISVADRPATEALRPLASQLLFGDPLRRGDAASLMPCRRHGAAREELRGKVRGGEDVRWRACVAVWGAK
jgi:hypothetical protein